jgi:hypothetical protein
VSGFTPAPQLKANDHETQTSDRKVEPIMLDPIKTIENRRSMLPMKSRFVRLASSIAALNEEQARCPSRTFDCPWAVFELAKSSLYLTMKKIKKNYKNC